MKHVTITAKSFFCANHFQSKTGVRLKARYCTGASRSVATVKKIIFTDLNALDYSIWDILQELVYEGRREPFANLKDLQNVIRDKWHDVDDH